MKRPMRQIGPVSPGPSFDPQNPPTEVWSLASSLFAPQKANTIDIDAYLEVAVGASGTLLTYQCPLNTWMYITQILFTCSDTGSRDCRFGVFVNGEPALPYHGASLEAWPNSDNYLWARGNTSYANEHLRLCNIKLAPSDILRVTARNNTELGTAGFGVRIVGYDSQTQPETDPRQM